MNRAFPAWGQKGQWRAVLATLLAVALIMGNVPVVSGPAWAAAADDVAVSLTASPGVAQVGDEITYTLTLEYTGDGSVAWWVYSATDQLRAITADYTDGSVILGPGGVYQHEIVGTYTVDRDDLTPGQPLTNEVTIELASDSGTSTLTATATVEIADLMVEKWVDSPAGGDGTPEVVTGNDVRYGVRVANTGTVTLWDVDISDFFDAAFLEYESISAVGGSPVVTVGEGFVNWFADGRLDVGEDVEFFLTFETLQTTSSDVENTASASAWFFGEDEELSGVVAGEDEAAIRIVEASPPPPDPGAALAVTKTLLTPDPFVNDEVAFRVTVENRADAPITGIQVTDSFDSGLAFVSLTGAPTTSVEPDSVTWDVYALNAGESVDFTVTFTAVSAGDWTNRVQASGNLNGEVVTSNEAVAVVDVDGPRAGLNLQVTAEPDEGPAPVAIGEEVIFTYTVQNTGDAPLENVRVVDPITGSWLSVTPWLPAGGVATKTYQHLVTEADVPMLISQAYATGEVRYGSEPHEVVIYRSNEVETTLEVDWTANVEAGLALEVNGEPVADPSTVELRAGDVLTIHYSATNTGDVTLDVVTVRDDALLGERVLRATDVAPSETVSVTRTYTVTEADLPALGIESSARGVFQWAPEEQEVVRDTASVTLQVGTAGLLRVTKTLLTSSPFLNSPVAFKVTVENLADAPINGIQVTDAFPSGLAFASLSGAAVTASDEDSVTWNVDSLGAGESAGFTVNFTATAAGTLVNRVQASGTLRDHAVVSNEAEAAVTVDGPDAALSLQVSARFSNSGQPADDVPIGGRVTFAYTVRNIGPSTLEDVEVFDELSGQWRHVADTLGPDETATTILEHTVTEADVPTLLSVAQAKGNFRYGTGDDQVATYYSPTVQTPVDVVWSAGIDADLTIEIDGVPVEDLSSAEVAVDDVITVHYRATNTGDVTLERIEIRDDELLGGQVTSAANVAPGKTVEATRTYTVTEDLAPEFTIENVATGTFAYGSGPTDPTQPTDTATVTLPVTWNGSIDLEVEVPASAEVGQEIVITYRITNTGNVTLQNVGLTDPLTGLVDVPIRDLSEGGNRLARGETRVIQVPYRVKQADVPGPLTANASVSGRFVHDQGSVTYTDADTAEIAVTWTAALALTITPSAAAVEPGQDVTFTYEVENTGNVTISDIVLTELDRGLTITLTQTNLQPGQTDTGSLTISVTGDDAPGPVTTRAEATGVFKRAGEAVTAEAEAEVDVAWTGNLEITYIGRPNSVEVGQDLTFTVTVENTGNVPMRNIRLRSPIRNADGEELFDDVIWPETRPLDVAVGAEHSFTFAYPVTEHALPGPLTATMHAVGVAPDGTTFRSETVPVEVAVTYTADLQLERPDLRDRNTGDPMVVRPGDTVTLTYVLRNIGNVTLRDLRVEETVRGTAPAGFDDPADVLREHRPDPATLTLAPGQEVPITVTYEVPLAVPPDTLSFVSIARGVDPLGNEVASTGPRPGNSVVDVDWDLGLAVDIAPGATETAVGETLNYAVTVMNTGDASVSGLTLDDIIARLAGSDRTNLETRQHMPDTPALILEPGASYTFNLTYDVTEAVVPGTLVLQATAGAVGPYGEPVSATSEVSLPVDYITGLTLTKTADVHTAEPGDTVTYTLIVTNTGNVTLRSLSLSDAKVGVGATRDALAPGAQWTINGVTYEVQSSDLPGPLTNTATVSAVGPAGEAVSTGASQSVTLRNPPAPGGGGGGGSGGGGEEEEEEEEEVTLEEQPPLAAPSWRDVIGHWAQQAIQALARLGVLVGTGDLFEPDRQVTRAEAAAMVARALGLDLQATGAFRDVPADAWYNGYVGAVVAAGLMQGYEDGTFRPDATITRTEATVLLVRAWERVRGAELPATGDPLSSFTDAADIPAWARPYLLKAVIADLIAGYGDGSLRPNAPVSRAEFATMLYRMMVMAGLI